MLSLILDDASTSDTILLNIVSNARFRIEPFAKDIPVEYVVELNQLIMLSMSDKKDECPSCIMLSKAQKSMVSMTFVYMCIDFSGGVINYLEVKQIMK